MRIVFTRRRGLRLALARRADLARAPRHERLHAAGRAVPFEILLENLVDFPVLVAVLDLPAALFLAPVGEFAAAAARRIGAQVAGAERQIARAGRAGVEVLVR